MLPFIVNEITTILVALGVVQVQPQPLPAFFLGTSRGGRITPSHRRIEVLWGNGVTTAARKNKVERGKPEGTFLVSRPAAPRLPPLRPTSRCAAVTRWRAQAASVPRLGGPHRCGSGPRENAPGCLHSFTHRVMLSPCVRPACGLWLPSVPSQFRFSHQPALHHSARRSGGSPSQSLCQ